MSSPARRRSRPAEASQPPRAERKMLVVLTGVTLVGAAGLAAGGSAGALLAAKVAKSDEAAGLPLGVLVLGSAAAAAALARLMPVLGRARSLALGYAIGSIGAALVIRALTNSSLPALLAGSTLLGAANAAVFLTRYAAAALVGPGARGRAVGAVLFATAIGAVLGAALLGPSARLAAAVGLPGESGLYVVALAVFASAAAILAVARASAAPSDVDAFADARVLPPREALEGTGARAAARLAMANLAAANFVMVAVMAVAPIHLRMGGMQLQMVGVVVAIHVAGMFAPAPFSGWFADRAGIGRVMTAGAVVLAVAAVVGAVASRSAFSALPWALALLGIGWNVAVVGGSTALATAMSGPARAYAEGMGEVAMGLAAAVAAPVAGVIAHLLGFEWVWVAAGAVAAASALLLRRAGHPAPATRGPARTPLAGEGAAAR